MNQYTLTAQPRSGRGKGPARRVRAQGCVPAIVYGAGRDPQPVSINSRDFGLALTHGLTSSTLITLQVEGEAAGDQPNLVILRELTRDPVTSQLEHADLYRVRLDQVVEFEIPVHGTGPCPAVKAGGILEHTMRTVTVRCKPMAVPQGFEVPLENLDFGRALHARDLQLPDDVELVTDPDQVILSVVMPRAVVSEQAATEGETPEGEAPAEPEVIGKGKKEESEES